MNSESESELFPTTFRETLFGAKFFERLAQLREQGATVETMQRNKLGNSVWDIVGRFSQNPP